MREVRFEVEGESVAGTLHEAAEARGNVVLVHGLLSQRGEFGDAPERLAARGWRVLVIDQRGFGASGGARGIVTQERATADVVGAFDFLAQGAPGVPEAVVGHSMGALFTLRSLATRASIRTGVLVAPMRSPRDEVNHAEYVGYRAAAAAATFKKRLGLGSIRVPYKFDYADLFDDAEAVRKAREAGFLVRQLDLSNVGGFLKMNAEDEARRVKQPVLTILASNDRVVKRANSLRVHEALAGHKELVTVGGGHSCWTDIENAAVVDHVDKWLREKLVA